MDKIAKEIWNIKVADTTQTADYYCISSTISSHKVDSETLHKDTRSNKYKTHKEKRKEQ